MLFSIVIPTLNESSSLSDALTDLLAKIDDPSQVEIIVSDGGSDDDTLPIAQQFPTQVVHSPAGRASQMNSGAQQATGEWIVFLHADTRLPKNWQSLITASAAKWGRFNVRLSGHHWMFRIIEQAMNFRSCKTAVATGDQVLFFQRLFFNQLGGYPDIKLMEDIAISKLARSTSPPACIQTPVITSSRRWEKKGILRTMILMWSLRLAYWLGINPNTLHRFYYS